MSEFEPGTPGFKSNFLQRNRIVSGLSVGVLVVEAKKKSGARNTANWAKKQGKKLFAVPGSIYSLNSWGPNYLIKTGAELVQSANDILKELQLKHLSFNGRVSSQISHIQSGNENFEKALILKTLAQKSLHIEKIIERTNLPAQKVLSMLSIMEIKGRIRNLGGNIFAIKH